MPRAVAEDWAFHLLLSAVMAEQGIAYTPGSIPTADLLGVSWTPEPVHPPTVDPVQATKVGT